MLRRSFRSLCAAGERPTFPEAGGFGMRLEDAYRIFGFRFGDKIEKPAINERFKKLAKEHHPDAAGGSNDAFLKLKEAHRIMVTHAHDARTVSPESEEAREVRIRKVRHADILHTVTRENAEEHRQVEKTDVAYGAIVTVAFFVSYYLWITRNIYRANDGRSRLTEEEVKPLREDKLLKPHHSWHPWKASNEVRDMVVEVEASRMERMRRPDPL